MRLFQCLRGLDMSSAADCHRVPPHLYRELIDEHPANSWKEQPLLIPPL